MAASVPAVREENLAHVLDLLRRDGAQTRSELVQATGLNRSTIAALVAELDADGLVTESLPGAGGGVGRPSPVVTVASAPVAIAVNPEVDAVTLAAVRLDQTLAVRERVPFRRPPTAAEVGGLVARWIPETLDAAAHRVIGVGLAVPGLVRSSDGVVVDAPHLGWRDDALAQRVGDAASVPTFVANDATLGALAEHRYGAGRDAFDIVYLNGGASGIGGGLIVGGVLVRGAAGFAGEFGHNRPGIIAAADRRADDGVLEDEVAQARLFAALGVSPGDGADLGEAMAAAGPSGRLEIARQRRILATALANAANVMNPAVVILGGFLAALADVDLAGLTADVRAQTMAGIADVEVRVAALGDDRLLAGAADRPFEGLISGLRAARG